MEKREARKLIRGLIKIANQKPVLKYIEVEPIPEEYNITNMDIENYYHKVEEQRLMEDSIEGKSLIISSIVTAILGYWYFEWIGMWISLFFIGPAIGIITKDIIFKYYIQKKIKIPNILDNINKYKEDKEAYKYWIEKKKRDYWLNMSGHEFEEQLAIVYKKNGFTAIVSPQAGDCGIDIELIKDNKVIIVQCKAHKRATGPSVVRDFYGTMLHNNVDEGIIASISGFTKGVYEFVKDKPIQLIELDDILNMIN